MKNIDSPITFGNSLARPATAYGPETGKPDGFLADNLSDSLAQVKDGTSHAAEAIAHDVKEGLVNAKGYVQEKLHSLEQQVAASPLQAITMAFATGAFLTLMFGRR